MICLQIRVNSYLYCCVSFVHRHGDNDLLEGSRTTNNNLLTWATIWVWWHPRHWDSTYTTSCPAQTRASHTKRWRQCWLPDKKKTTHVRDIPFLIENIPFATRVRSNNNISTSGEKYFSWSKMRFPWVDFAWHCVPPTTALLHGDSQTPGHIWALPQETKRREAIQTTNCFESWTCKEKSRNTARRE